MLKRVRHILLLIILISGAMQTLAQIAMPDKVCIGANKRYWVLGLPGSVYTWKIDGVVQSQSTDFIEITWTAAGTFKLEVQEHQNNCDGDIQSGLVDIFKLEAEVSSSNITCFGANDGIISIANSKGGSGTYEYNIGKGWSPLTEFKNLLPGIYTVEMRDALPPACVVTLKTVEIVEPKPLSATLESTNATCLGNDGTISVVSPQGGSGSFEFSLNGGFWTTGYFIGLVPGNYLVEMRDLNVPDCKRTLGTITITKPVPITATLTKIDVSCFGGNDGKITVSNAKNGSGIYEYRINGGSWGIGLEFSNLTAGTYTIEMRDYAAQSCVVSLPSVNIIEPNQMTANVASTNVSCFGSKDGTITIQNSNGGSGAYEYSIDGTSWATKTSYTNLAPGTYYVLMRDANAVKCVVSVKEIVITEPLQLTATVTPTDISCYGANDGKITISDSKNGTPAYQYSIDGINWIPVPEFTGLGPNTYTVQMRDSKGCKETIGTVTIVEPKPLTAVVDYTNATCLGNDGTITITNPENSVSGLYEYTIDGINWVSSGQFTGLSAKIYSVRIRDANLKTCEQSLKNITITEPLPMLATAAKTNVTCFAANDGTITVSGQTNGSGVYEYSVDGINWTGNPILSGLAPNTYTVQMRDANATSCLITIGALTISEPNKLNATATAKHVTCFEGSDGQIIMTNQVGGSGTYEYSVDGINWSAGKVDNLTAKTYSVQMRDAAVITCIVSLGDVEVKQPEKLTATLVPTHVTCFDGNDGAITITNPVNGVGPYQFSLDGGVTWQSNVNFTGLKAKVYTLLVIQDANNCVVALDPVAITQPDKLEATTVHTNETLPGLNDGTITIDDQKGGSGAYEYSIDGINWQTTLVFTNLAPATYTVRMRDAAVTDCIINIPVIILPAGSITAEFDHTDVTCFGGFDGTITFKNATGATSFQYSVNNGVNWQSTAFFPGLTAKQYTLVVRDAITNLNQAIIGTVDINQPTQLEALVAVTPESFAGATDGALTISGQKGGSGFYQYSLDGTNWKGSPVFSGLTSGTYTVQIRDLNAPTCSISIPKIIQPAGALTADVSSTNVSCFNGNNGSIVITNASGAGTFGYSIDGGTTWKPVGVFNGLIAGNYDVQIRDAGKPANVVPLNKITLTQPTKLSATFTNYTAPLCYGQSGSFTIKGLGGTEPYTGTGDFVLPSGATKVYIISDKNGCIASLTVAMPDPPKIIATSVINSPKCFGENGTVTISATGGTGDLSINGTNLPTGGSLTFTVQAGKSYSFKAIDANGCSSNTISGIMPPSEILKVNITPVSSLCVGGSATVTVSATGGIPPYISGTGTFTVGIGKHTFAVTDTQGCIASADITISVKDPPADPVLSVSVKPNCLIATGTIKVDSPLGANYLYSLDGGVYTPATTFANLAPGSTHTVKVKDTTTGCESMASSVTVDKIPAAPLAPVVSMIQPGCIVPKGTIEVTEPKAGTGFEYSFDGGAFSSVSTLANLSPGSSHSIKVRDILTGCQSATTTVKIDLLPLSPLPPVAKITISPTCNNLDGAVEVTSPLGADLVYSLNGGPYQASTKFDKLLTGTYTIKVKNVKTECESALGTVVVPAIPPSPVLASVAQENPKCYGEPGSISFTISNAPDGDNYVIKYQGGQFTNVKITGGKATVVAYAGDYNIITIEANGCISEEKVNVTITQPSAVAITEKITEIDLKSKKKGEISITISGGTQFSGTNPYQIQWSTGQTTTAIKDLNQGAYTVTVTDKNGCIASKVIQIPAPNYPPEARDDDFIAGCAGITRNLFEDNGHGIDSDPEDDPFFIDLKLIENPKNGTVVINPDLSGSFTYVANPGYTGIDKFRYAIYDKNHYQGDTATVSIGIAADFDGDGIADGIDPDADGDGILNLAEGGYTLDSDGDGHPNWLDIDDDNDGIVDNIEGQPYAAGYVAPSGRDDNNNGLDDAYDTTQGGTNIVPVDTDMDGIPDFLDADSDDDLVPDYIEGHDGINADGRPTNVLSGKDTDGDGLDDAFDTVVNGCNNGNAIGSNAPLQDFDLDGKHDWRDENDDDDEYLTRFEDLNVDGDYSNDDIDFDGHPEYLDYGRECDLFIPDAFSPNDDNVHDYFQIYCMIQFPNAKMYIFDQLGNKLYEKENYGNMDFWKTPDQAWWDGTTNNRSAAVNGRKVIPGTYYYVLRLGNGEVKKSSVFVSY